MTQTLDVVQIPVLQDNYVYLLHDAEYGETAAIDPSVAGPVLEALHRRGWKLTAILNTHHHGDHTGGNLELKEKTGCTIYGYAEDADRIPGIDVRLKDGERVSIGSAEGQVIAVPGHTTGHIVYYFSQENMLFCGDTLFSCGCGRLFEGSPEQMHASLSKLKELPDMTRMFCAHEYSLNNTNFALTLEPHNHALLKRKKEVEALRALGQSTINTTMGQEKAFNPFLRWQSGDIRRTLGMEEANDVEVFAEIRRRRNGF